MIYVGIDVANDKHDCFISNSDGEALFNVFTITNNLEGFNDLFNKIISVEINPDNVKIGLEATVIIITIFWDFSLIKVCPPLLSILFIQICLGKVSACVSLKPTKLMPVQLHL